MSSAAVVIECVAHALDSSQCIAFFLVYTPCFVVHGVCVDAGSVCIADCCIYYCKMYIIATIIVYIIHIPME